MMTGNMLLSKLGIDNLKNDDLINSTYGKHQKEDTTDYYNLILFKRCNKNNENRRNRRDMALQMISIFQYMQAHDEFEIKANKIKQTKLNEYMRTYRLNQENIGFYHRNTNYVRPYLLPSLQFAETQSEGILYNSKFYPNKLHEYYDEDNGEDIQIYMKLLFTQKFVRNTNLNRAQKNELETALSQNNHRLYVFYYNLNEKIQRKIEIIINNYFLNNVFEIYSNYLPEEIVQMVNVGPKQVPPHMYAELIGEIANHYGITIE
uniref:Uncharacterized protein n=1 Tax=Meloidogyne javanica TaxID=6303 RepID=A0A915MIH3_MELJA